MATVELPAQPSASDGGTVGAVFGVLAVIICLTVVGVIFAVVGYSLLKKRSKNALDALDFNSTENIISYILKTIWSLNLL